MQFRWIGTGLSVGLLGTALGCNAVLPTCSPSQLWPRYLQQQAEINYACRHDTCGLARIPTPGQPASDHREGFLDGYQSVKGREWNVGPRPCYPVGWNWTVRPLYTPPTPAYLAGYAEGESVAWSSSVPAGKSR